jgi:hypothetical protein
MEGASRGFRSTISAAPSSRFVTNPRLEVDDNIAAKACEKGGRLNDLVRRAFASGVQTMRIAQAARDPACLPLFGEDACIYM